MLQLSKAVINQPIMSLRTGGQVATATSPIINPNNLRIEGWYCQDGFSNKTLVLLSQDVRDVLKQGLVIDDHDNLTEPNELIRLKDILEIDFRLLGMSVTTVNHQRMGKVTDFAVELGTFYIQKIYLTQSLMKGLSGGNLGVDRNQIIEITNRKIVIEDPLKPVKASTATAPATP